MTVCVAAICGGGKMIVVAADRMVTAGPPMNLEFEHDGSKVTALTAGCVVMNAGDALLAHEILRSVRAGLQSQPDVVQLADVLVDLYGRARKSRINEQLGATGLSLASFLADGLKQLGPMFPQVFQQVSQMNANVELLLAGFTAHDEARLAFVHNPGAVRWFDVLGFHAIGSGGMHATMTLIGAGHSTAASAENGLLNVYTAKRNAEAAPGVGRQTDLLIVTANAAPRAVGPEALDELGKLYENSRRPSDVNYDRLKEILHAGP